MPLGRYGHRDRGTRKVEQNRIRFLNEEAVEAGGVREPILASWWRSRRHEVPADRIDLSYVRDPDVDTPLVRSAEPVLRALADQLDGQPISIVLTEPSGLVLCRLTADADLERHLDRVRLAPGFSYAEEYVGTNGIGTALEGGRAMHVFGHEHYAEHLEDLACAGVPITHPVTGGTVGVLDLTCWRKDAGPLLATLAKATTEQIRAAMLADTSAEQIELLQEYLRAAHRSAGAVFALSADVVMINDQARALLDPTDQDVLLRQAADAERTSRTTQQLELPSGQRVRLSLRPVGGSGRQRGIVGQFRLIESEAPPSDTATTGRMLLPGLMGTGAVWRRACDEAEALCGNGVWTVLEGEAGTGKHALLRAVHQRRRPTGRLTDLDLAEGRWADERHHSLTDPDATVLLRHIDRLDGVRLRVLTTELQAAKGAGSGAAWVAATTGPGPKRAELQRLLEAFPRTVVVPPLRHHAEDVPRLVDFFLGRLGYAGKLRCAPEVMQLFGRASWPGNAGQVLDVLRTVVRHRRSGTVTLDDLPPEMLTVSRHRLSPIEAMERDAIVRSLRDAHDNKAEAARALGMSRATIYRKIHEYGIVPPQAGAGRSKPRPAAPA